MTIRSGVADSMIFQRNHVQQTHVGLYKKLMISLEDYHMMWSENDIIHHPRPQCPFSKASPYTECC